MVRYGERIGSAEQRMARPGDYVAVQVVSAAAGSLTCELLGLTTISDFVGVHGSTTPSRIYDGHVSKDPTIMQIESAVHAVA